MENISIIINLCLCVLSFILALLSIIFVILTLRQNQKLIMQNNLMIENATRPYVTIYLDSVTICEQASFFVLKNFGQSIAQITDFEYDPILKTLEDGNSEASRLINEQFDFVKGLSLAPGQSKMLLCSVTKIPKKSLNFKIVYNYAGKSYDETLTLNVKNYSHIPVPRPDTHILEGNERQVHSLREIIERLI